MTLMVAAFDDEHLVLRLYRKAGAVHPDNNDWNELYARSTPATGVRQFLIWIWGLYRGHAALACRILTMPGIGAIGRLGRNKGRQGVMGDWQQKNGFPIDGLVPGTGSPDSQAPGT
ncbi:MAG: hypothetical protein OEZ10_06365 [Gammaproteobacteria bacterium]|nr:hypothetical protein [Gammaproteobacteria bacterium]